MTSASSSRIHNEVGCRFISRVGSNSFEIYSIFFLFFVSFLQDTSKVELAVVTSKFGKH